MPPKQSSRQSSASKPSSSKPRSGKSSHAKAKAKAPATAEQTAPDLLAPTQPTAHMGLELLEVQDSADLDALLLDKRVGEHVALRLAPELALLHAGSHAEVLAALRAAGHTPKVQVAATGEGEGGA